MRTLATRESLRSYPSAYHAIPRRPRPPPAEVLGAWPSGAASRADRNAPGEALARSPFVLQAPMRCESSTRFSRYRERSTRSGCCSIHMRSAFTIIVTSDRRFVQML